MNDLARNKALAGAATLLVQHSFVLLRSLGLDIPLSVDAAAAMWMSAAMSLYLIWHGYGDARDAMPPTKEAPNV